MGKQTTPLAAAFFRMLIFGGLVGVLSSIAFQVLGSPTSAFPGILTVLIQAVTGFIAGIPVAATVAAPAIGLHTLAAAHASRIRVPATALGAVLGPLTAVGFVLGESPFDTLVPGIVWAVFLPFAALTAVYFTRPLRRAGVESSSIREWT